MKHLAIRFSPLIFILIAIFALPERAMAQMGLPQKPAESVAIVDAPSPNDLKEFSRLLSDPRIVEWLKKSAQQVAASNDAATIAENSVRQQIEQGMATIRTRLGEIETAVSDLPSAPSSVMSIWQSHITGSQTLRTIAFTIIFLFVGAGLEWLFWQYFTPTLQRVEFSHYTTLRERVNSALIRISLIGAALIVFTIGSVGAFLSFDWPPIVQHIVISFLIAIIVIRVVLAITKFLTAPKFPELRFVPLSSGPAKRLYKWAGISVITTAFGIMISDTFSFLSTLPNAPKSAQTASLSVSIFTAIIITTLLLIAVWRMNKSAQKTRQDSAETTLKKSNASAILLSILIVASAILWLLGAHEFMWTLIIIGLIVPAIALVSRLIDHLFNQAEGEALQDDQLQLENNTDDDPVSEEQADEEEQPEPDTKYDLFRPVTIRLSRFVLIIAAIIALAGVWGVSILSLSNSQSISGRVFSIAVDVTVSLLIADLIWVWAKTAIDRRMADFGDLFEAGGEGGGSAGPEARMATLLPILRKILMITIILMVSLSVLSSLGINIGPILAGAGVAGIAIGFGAQALVRDIVSGIFFLLDDAFRVGEYIEMGDLRGTVESMSLRSLRVRHHLGAIHTIPFGELKSLTNYSRDWVIMKLEFRVPFDTDIKLVKKLIKKVNAELQANEAYGHHLLQPLKSQGVRRMEEFNMVIGVKFMASPGEQWLIRRDAYQRIRDVFTENGIDFAQRNVKVEVISDQPITPAVEKAAASAAQEATENQLPPAPAPDEP